MWGEVGGRRHLMRLSPRASATQPYDRPEVLQAAWGVSFGRPGATGDRGVHPEPMELTPDWCGSTKEWARDITFIDDPRGLAVLWHSWRGVVMFSSRRGDAGGRSPTRGWCERRVLVQGIVALGTRRDVSGPQREGEPRGVVCAGFRDRLRERGFGRGGRWLLLSGCCVAPPCSLGVHPPLRPRGADRGNWACPNRRSWDGGWCERTRCQVSASGRGWWL